METPPVQREPLEPWWPEWLERWRTAWVQRWTSARPEQGSAARRRPRAWTAGAWRELGAQSFPLAVLEEEGAGVHLAHGGRLGGGRGALEEGLEPAGHGVAGEQAG